MMNNTGMIWQDLSLQNIASWVFDIGPTVLVILLLAIVSNHFARRGIEQIIRHSVRNTRFSHTTFTPTDLKKRQETLISLCSNIFYALVWIIAVLTIVKTIFGDKIDLTPLFASAGIIGIALGFGAQSIIKDFLTGVFIITENQYRVGDVVDIDTGTGASGTVEKVSIRSTVVRDVDGNVHYVPNGSIIHVVNKTMGFSKVNLTINVGPDTNIEKLAEVINETGEKLTASETWKDKIIEAPKFLSIGSFSDTALEVTISGKTQPSQQWSVAGELRKRLRAAFKKSGIRLVTVPANTAAGADGKKS